MNRSFRTVISVALAAAAAGTSPADALEPIDDFEIGSFAMWTAPNNNCVFDTLLLNGYEPHVISQMRIVTLCGIGDNGSTARIDAGFQLDDYLLFTAGGNETDFLRIDYNWGFPRTLTYGGVLDRIEVEMAGIVPGGRLTITIWDANAGVSSSRTLTSAGIITLPLSDFLGVNVEQARRIQISLSASNQAGAFLVSDIRLRGPGHWGLARTVNFEGDFVATEVPPIPSPPLSFRMADPAEGTQLYRTNMAITRAESEGPQPSLYAEWSDAPALGEEIGGMIFMGIQPEPFRDTTFDLAVDLFPAGLAAQIIGEPTLSANPVGLLLTFPVQLTDAAGEEIGRSETRIHLDVHQSQTIELADVQLTPSDGAILGWSNGFIISFTLDVIGALDQTRPLFETMWIADWSQRPATAVGDWSSARLARSGGLIAWPSVTHDGTDLRMSAPFDAGSALAVHDASGRLVRRLVAHRAAASLRWDGRDERGARVAPGIYFARIEGDSPHAAARIVCVR